VGRGSHTEGETTKWGVVTCQAGCHVSTSATMCSMLRSMWHSCCPWTPPRSTHCTWSHWLPLLQQLPASLSCCMRHTSCRAAVCPHMYTT
jgi:hypothetical protein